MAHPGAQARHRLHLWWWRASLLLRREDLALLSPSELRRMAALRSGEQRTAFAAIHAHVRRLLGDLLEVSPDLIELRQRPCPECTSREHGPPGVSCPDGRNVEVSLAHSDGTAILAASFDHPVGVDLEHVRPIDLRLLAPWALTPSERAVILHALAAEEFRLAAFQRCWTRKEAVLKAMGIGLAADLTAIETEPASAGPVEIRDPSGEGRWRVHDLPLPAGWIGAVAHPATHDATLICHPPAHGLSGARAL